MSSLPPSPLPEGVQPVDNGPNNNESTESANPLKGVDEELQATITNLVSALGGPDITQVHRPYKLGDDALACLRDLKKWLRVFDEKQERLDVARAIAETSLVTFDLLEILSQWDLEEEEADRKQTNSLDLESESEKPARAAKRFRIALACLELLVPLTWPIVLNPESSESYFFHSPSLRRSYILYKQAILTHPKQRVFRAIIRLCLPALQADPEKRSARDEGILKLAIFFIRNILQINVKDDPNESEDIARSNEVQVLSNQTVLDFLVMIASGIGESFKFHSAPVMECIYHLLYGLKIHQVLDILPDFTASTIAKPHQALKELLAMEKTVKQNMQRTAPTRHNRFGTIISVQTPDNGRLTVSGQPALLNTSLTLGNLDAAKKWHRPKRVDIKNRQEWDVNINLTEETRSQLNVFVVSFLDSGYNPLFGDLRKVFERELGEYSKTLLPEHQVQFLYLVSWFLEAERARHVIKATFAKRGSVRKEEDYNRVASTLNQTMFIIVMNSMRNSYEDKQWHIVYASMLCFKEILNTVNQMESQGTEEMQDMAENIKSRLFYEEHSLDLLAQIPKTAHARDISYLNLAVELTHIVLQALQKYATDKQTIYIRSKRQTQQRRKKKKDAQAENGIDPEDGVEAENESDSEVERKKTAQNIRERKFNFEVFETKFMTEETLDSYIKYLKNHKELNKRQIMYAIKFFHRIFVKRRLHYYFYRLDLMKLFDDLVGVEASKYSLTMDNSTRKEISQFVCYFVRHLKASLEKTPSLFVELLFQKAPEDLFYFENGFDKPEKPAKKIKAVGQPFEFTNEAYTENREHKFAIVVACLIDEDKTTLVEWAADTLGKAYSKRAAWITMAAADDVLETPQPPEERMLMSFFSSLLLVLPISNNFTLVIASSDAEIKDALEKDKKLQLLLELSGCKFSTSTGKAKKKS